MKAVLFMAFAAGLGMCGAAAADEAAPPKAPSLADAVQSGHQMFTSDSFGGSGTCETCHLNGGTTEGKTPDGKAIPSLVGAAAHYPRYAAKSEMVITLSRQMARCIKGALQGAPPPPGSKDLVFLETYVASLSKGATMGPQFK